MLAGILFAIAESFLFTMVLEWTAAWFLGCSWRKDFRHILQINLITNPAVVLVFNLIWMSGSQKGAWSLLAVLEILVVLLEAVMIRGWMKKEWREALHLSFFMNGISALTGIAITILRNLI